VEETSLSSRLGGATGVEALVRKLHQQFRGDPELAALTDQILDDRCRAADAKLLRQVLDRHNVAGLDPDLMRRSTLFTAPDLALRHLRDALWLQGTSAGLAEQVIDAVSAAQHDRHRSRDGKPRDVAR
jgi:hypothetical protein